MVRICLVGASGRLGQRLLRILPDYQDVRLGSVLMRSGGKPVYVDGLVTTDMAAALRDVDVVIDFSAPSICGAIAPLCAAKNVALLVASTGLTAEDEAILATAAAHTAILQAANLSLGVNVMLELVELAARRLAAYDVEILDLHHRHKRDAPSGTAYALGAAVTQGAGLRPSPVVGRAGMCAPRQANELGYAAIRGGEVAGEHTVYFFGEAERLEITHRSTDAAIFAAGALHAARWLAGRTPGRYSMRDVLRT